MTLTFDSKVISVFRDLCSNLDTMIGNKCAKSESSRFKITFKLRMLADKRYLLRHTPGTTIFTVFILSYVSYQLTQVYILKCHLFPLSLSTPFVPKHEKIK